MSESTLSVLQADHRHWLRDVDRWKTYLGTWDQEKESFIEGAKRFQQRVDQYCADLKTYAETLEAHCQEIACAERLALESSVSSKGALEKGHDNRAKHHEALHRLHERLQQRYHAISTLLAAIQPAGTSEH